jgi:hypothetical protein
MTCRNCGAELTGEFCAACGQRAIDPDPTLRELGHELAEEFLHWDGKLAATFRTLVTRPGALTAEYLAGRRIRFISPLRLYLTCSVLYFALSALVPAEMRLSMSVGSTTVGSTAPSDTAAALAALDTLGQHGRWVGRVWGAHFARAIRRRDELQHAIASAIPKIMFVLVPLFAAIVGLAYRSRRRRYPAHLAFALHVHAFLFLALTVMLLRRIVPGALLQVAITLLGAIAIAWYFMRAARTVYGGSRIATIGLSVAIVASYGVAFFVTMGLTFSLVVLLQF